MTQCNIQQLHQNTGESNECGMKVNKATRVHNTFMSTVNEEFESCNFSKSQNNWATSSCCKMKPDQKKISSEQLFQEL